MKLPAILARFKEKELFVLAEGEAVKDFLQEETLEQLQAEMGMGWDLWEERAMQQPEGAHFVRRTNKFEHSQKSIRLTPEEVRNLPQPLVPFFAT